MAKRARITPARAGKTVFSLFFSNLSQDHPRSCGKDLRFQVKKREGRGSPPLVRERQIPVRDNYIKIGITPARAGKTVMDPLILANFFLPVFKIYLTSLQDI